MVDAWNLTILKPEVLASTGGTATNRDNLLTVQPGEKATFATGQTAIFDLGASKPLRQLALLYTTGGAGETARITASANADGITGATIDSGVMALDAQALERPSGYRHFFYHRLAGSVNARYVRVVVTGALTAGRLAVGTPFQPEDNAAFGDTGWGYEEADSPDLLDSGVEVVYDMVASPVLQFTLDAVTEAELNGSLEPLARLQHEGWPVLVARRPDPHAYLHNGLYYGLLRMGPASAVEFDMHEVSASIRTML